VRNKSAMKSYNCEGNLIKLKSDKGNQNWKPFLLGESFLKRLVSVEQRAGVLILRQ
jgi:hypothetical protein